MTDQTLRPAGPPVGPPPIRARRWPAARRVGAPEGILVVLAGLAGLAYAWAIGRDPLEPYYEAAVRSMAGRWRDFFFGGFDPAGTVTLDKLPGAFWVQALSVRIFGFHTWAMVLPQVIEGVLTVLLLYRAVRRLAGPAAGLIAAAVVVVSPATVALNRGNISDTLMILLLVAAADAVSAAVVTGSPRRLVLAGALVGLAFQAKMIEAWMVLPAFGLVYLLEAPGGIGRRLRHIAVAGAVTAVVSLSWMTVVALVPGSDRPYVDGSHHDSPYEQVFVYNGFGRFGQETPLQILAGQSPGLGQVVRSPPVGPARLLHGDLGRDSGWLLPAGIVVAAWGALARRRQPRGDRLRAGFVLWGVWLVVLAVVFSFTTTVNDYYTAALTPALAALAGTGFVAVWPDATWSGSGRGARSVRDRRLGVAGLATGGAGYAAWLVNRPGSDAPGWVFPLVVAVGAIAVLAAWAAVLGGGRRVFAAAVAGTLVAASVGPAVATAVLIDRHQGAFDTPFEPAAERAAILQLFVRTPADVALIVPALERVQQGAPWLLATQTAAVASVFIDATGKEVLPLGGFTGTVPSPTTAQLARWARAGKFHLTLIASASDPRTRWVAAHCLDVGPAPNNLHNYFCGGRAASRASSPATRVGGATQR